MYGIYFIHREGLLLYVGKSSEVENRIANHQHIGNKRRPNETLYTYIINYLRPDLTTDPRSIVDIAVEYLRGCTFSWLPCDAKGMGKVENWWRHEAHPVFN